MFKVLVRVLMVSMAAVVLLAQEASDTSSVSSYDGPNVMGRGAMRIGLSGAESIPIRFSFNLSGTYDTMLGGFRTDADGNLAPAAGSYGVQGGFDVSGQKRFRRSMVGLSYSGNYNYFPNVPGFSGANQALNLGFARRISRRIEMNWMNTASLTNRILGNPLMQQSIGADLVSAPVNELFDNRIAFLQSQMVVSYRLSARWQLVAGGNGGLVRRDARGLADANLYGATSGIMYRWDRNTTIGVDYNFSHFNFGRAFGESNIHGVSANFGRKFGRDWQLISTIGVQSVHTIGSRRVSLDPVIAALLGSDTGVEAFDSTRRIAGFSVALERRYRRSSFSARADRGVVPGNGLLLTSVINSQTVGATYNASRNWTVNGSFGRNSMEEVLGASIGAFNSWQVQGNVTRSLSTELALTGTVEYRTFRLLGSTLDRRGTRYVIGLNYTPTSLPFGR